MITKIKEIYSYRELIKNLVIKDLKVRYKRSALGFFWSLLNPLLMMCVFWLVFTRIIRFDIPRFPIFLLSGLLPWNFFALSLSFSVVSLLANADLLKKTYFPRQALIISIVLSQMVNFLLALIPLVIIMLLAKNPFSWSLLALPGVIIIHSFFILGLCLLLACSNVYFRDTAQVIEVALLAWFYLTPVFYPLELVKSLSANWLRIYHLNPMIYMTELYRSIIYRASLPDWYTALYSCISAMIVFFIGWWVFSAKEHSLVREL